MNRPPSALDIPFDNSYARLPPEFFERLSPSAVKAPSLIQLNESLAVSLGLAPEELASETGVSMMAGNHVPEGAEPLAMAYAGHQFGNWVPQLGDGRAILLGELIDNHGVRQDIQLKGAGRTAWSRGGDGRNWMGPVLREYIVSEAMAALGIPTTRALAAVATGEKIYRESGAMPGAVLVRVASSHIRVGTFQYFIARQNIEAVKALVDHVIDRHYPDAGHAERPALALLEAVVDAQASLVAHWQSVGFIHGVMNTDNSSVAGITIDYGPCAFMDHYDPEKVFSSIDVGGRYAYQNQPQIAQWNMANLAQCLLPLIDEEPDKSVELAQASVNRFSDAYKHHYEQRFTAKIGLEQTREDNLELIDDLLSLLTGTDFTIAFRTLSTDHSDLQTLVAKPGIEQWLERWEQRLDESGRSVAEARIAMQRVNPAVIPRNHQIEATIRAAIDDGDFTPFGRINEALATPYSLKDEFADLTQAPKEDEQVTKTFCGT